MDWSELQGLLTSLLQAVIVVLVPVLAFYAKRWMTGCGEQAWQQATMEEQEMIRWVVTSLVTAAEQLYKDKQLAGPEKLEYVMNEAATWLSGLGVEVPPEVLRALVEAVLGEWAREK